MTLDSKTINNRENKLKVLLARLTCFYSVFVLLWFLLNQIAQDSWWGLVVLDKFSEYFILPAVFVFLISLLTRKTIPILLATLPVGICAYFYLTLITPFSTPELLGDDQRFRVGTYNIWNQNKAIDDVVEILGDTKSDVIAVQEITEEQRAALTAGLKPEYPYFYISKPVFGGTTALFSRYELTNIIEIDIDIDRPSIVADLVWNEHPITIASAHLNPSFWAYWQQPWHKIPGNYHQYIKKQNAQAKAIITELANRTDRADQAGKGGVFLACDCNSQEPASTNRLLAKHLNETLRVVGWQFGKTGSSNLVFERKVTHIDYIWYSGATLPNAIYRWTQSAGSDHAPVIADFIFKQ